MSLDGPGPYKGDNYYDNNENIDINNYRGEDDYNINSNNEQLGYDDEENVILPGVDDLPIFATPEAIKQQQDQERRIEAINKIELEVSDLEDRIRVMKEHSKNVTQELDHTNALYNAKKSEIHAEEHLRQLAERQLGRSKSDSKKIQLEIELIQSQLNTVQSLIYKSNEKLDEFKIQMNWNQEELEQWATAAKQKEEDNLSLQKYTRSDEFKIKEQTLRLEQLTKELLHRKELLENEITETQAKQMELDRIAVDFRESHAERQNLVQRWQDTINEIKKRDAEINGTGEKFARAKNERNAKEMLLITQRKRLEAQQRENRDVESKTESFSKIVGKKREELMTGSKKQLEFKDELESLKNELATAAEGLQSKRAQNSNKQSLVEARKLQLERERIKYQAAKEILESVKSSGKDVEANAREYEDLLVQREREITSMITKLKAVKEKLFKESHLVHEMKKEEARLHTEVAGMKSQSKNLDAQLAILDKDSSRQQELLYNAEFQIQQIERKIARGLGERSDEEKRALKAQIDSCEAAVVQARDKRKLLVGQVRKLQNELITSKVHKDDLHSKNTSLKEKLSEKEIENRTMEDEMKRDTKAKEEVVVQIDLLRLEVKRFKDILSSKADAVFTLENRKQQLLLSMEERKAEIAVHRDVLKAEFKGLSEEKHKLIMDLRNREGVVDNLKSRFEASSGVGGDAEGKSQSFFIIQAAQKREELQRRGDELDHLIRLADRELRAQQLTLDHINARNLAFRDSFVKVDLKGDEAQVLKQLEDRTKLSKDEVFRKKKELQRLNTDLEEDGRRLDQVKNQLARINQQREHLQNAKQQIEEDLNLQQNQIDEAGAKAQSSIYKYREKLAELKGIDVSVFANGTLEEKSVRAEVLKDCVQNVLFTLGQLSNEFPEVADALSTRLKEADLRVPSKPPVGTVMSRAATGNVGGGGGGGNENHLQQSSTTSSRQANNSIVVPQRNFEMGL